MLIFYDLETTGLNPYHNKITEYCFIKYSENQKAVVSVKSELVNPMVTLSDRIVKVTKITDDMLKDKSPFNKEMGNRVFSHLMSYENDTNQTQRYMIAHNGDVFDKIFLKEHLNQVGIKINSFGFRYIDTLLFARMMYPHLNTFRLGYLIEKMGIMKREGHRAENDTYMLKDLYTYMCKDLSTRHQKNESYYLNNPHLVYDLIYN